MAKVGQQVLLSPLEKQRILAAAIVRQESQAEVARWLVAAALPQLEHAHSSQLAELRTALEGMNVDTGEALADMAEVLVRSDGTRRRLTLADLRTAEGTWRKSFPWGKRTIKA